MKEIFLHGFVTIFYVIIKLKQQVLEDIRVNLISKYRTILRTSNLACHKAAEVDHYMQEIVE
ncbi:MAG: hypothetical protein M1133_15935 [Armatimonadetes bacterium]|nr:hypothetical protein [Armatimonadota bacterium]